MRILGRLSILTFVAILLGGIPRATADSPSRTLAGTWSFEEDALRGVHVEGLSIRGEVLALDPTAERGTLLTGPLAADFEFIALGATWVGDARPDLEVRVSPDGRSWGPWFSFEVESDDRPDEQPLNGTDLLFIWGRFAQLRVALSRPAEGAGAPSLQGLRLTYLDTRRGPDATVAAAAATQGLPGEPPVISRAAWGADESLRYRNGEEIWTREYRRPLKIFLHHTATSNNIPDPAAAVRAVYYYHAVTRGWGDIGYHFILDHQGRVYEGRYGDTGGRELVVAAHAYRYNYGSLGISTLGNFQLIAYPEAAEAALTSLIAARANHYGIHPTGSGFFVDRWFPHNILGHRDVGAEFGPTTCPGESFYARLPAIRETSWNKLSALELWLTAPDFPSPFEGTQTFDVDASPAISRIELFVDDVYWGTDPTRPFNVIVTSAGVPAGPHLARIVGVTDAGTSITLERPFQVAGSPEATATTAPPTAIPPPTSTPIPQPPGRLVLWLPVFAHAMIGATVVPPTPAPACTQLLTNGTMEVDGGWLPRASTLPPVFTSEQAHGGTRSLMLGLPRGASQSGVSWASTHQPVTLPSTLSSAALEVWIKGEGASEDDRQFIWVRDEDDKVIEPAVLAATESGDWRLLHYDLTRFAGRTLLIYAGVKNDGQGETARLYLDDARLLVCP